MGKKYITNQNIYDAIHDLRIEMKKDIESLEQEVRINTAFRNNLEGKIAMGVIALGTFISAITAVFTTGLKRLIFGK